MTLRQQFVKQRKALIIEWRKQSKTIKRTQGKEAYRKQRKEHLATIKALKAEYLKNKNKGIKKLDEVKDVDIISQEENDRLKSIRKDKKAIQRLNKQQEDLDKWIDKYIPADEVEYHKMWKGYKSKITSHYKK